MTHTDSQVPDMEEVDCGLEALLDPKRNRNAQMKSFFRFGMPTGIIVGGIIFGVFLLTKDVPLAAAMGSIGFLFGLWWSFYEVDTHRNAVPTFFGSFDETWVGPSGWGWYWPQPFGSLFLQAAVGERQTDPITVQNVETSNGTRFVVIIKVRRWFVRWPLPYLRAIESTRDNKAPEKAMVELLSATVRKYVNLHSDEAMLKVRDMNLQLANVLSGEVDEIQIPPDEVKDPGAETVTFQFSGGEESKTLHERLMQYGISIPNGGIDVIDINEPDDVAAARAEAREADVRGKTIEERAALVADLQKKHPKVDIHNIIEELMADGKHADASMVIVRGDAGDFTKGAAIKNRPSND